MAMIRFWLIGVLTVLTVVGAGSTAAARVPKLAPPPAPDAPNWFPEGRTRFQVYTEKEGLPQQIVGCMAFDASGYLWVGTGSTLVRYNGHKWSKVNFPPHLNLSFVREMLPSADGSLWLGLQDQGVFRYQAGQWTAFTTANSGIATNRVRHLLETKDAVGNLTLWIATNGGGVSCYRAGKWTTFNTTNSGLPDDWVRSLAETRDSAGNSILWIGTASGLARYADGKWTTLNRSNSSLPDTQVWGLLGTRNAAGQPVLWVGMDSGGLARLEGDRWTIFTASDCQILKNQIFKVVESQDFTGNPVLWVGTSGGLARYADGRWTAFTTANSNLPNDEVWNLLERREPSGGSTLWIGTGSGLARYTTGQWTAFTTSNTGLPNNQVWDVLVSQSQPGPPVIWVGTNGGLARFQAGEWKTFTTTNSGLAANQVWRLLEVRDPDGQPVLWIGTNRGLVRFKAGEWTTFTTFNSGLPNNQVGCLLETRDVTGQPVLWAGTNGGLARYVDGNWSIFNKSNSPLPDDWILSLLEGHDTDGQSVLWIATNGGLIRYKQGDWLVLTKTNSGLPENGVRGLLETRSDTAAPVLWVGTSEGLSRYSMAGGQWLPMPEGVTRELSNRGVGHLCQDLNGRFYLLNSGGVTRLSPRTPTLKNPDEFEVYTFTTDDGLPHDGCNATSTRDNQGRIWIGTVGGFAVFDPRMWAEDHSPKPLYLEHTWVNDQERPLTSQQVSLSYEENNLAFEYVLLSYFKERLTRYQTQLIGYDPRGSDWTEDARRNYTNLPVGDYTFQVWGKDHAGNVSGPVQVVFRIQPAPWHTWWAYLAYALIATGSVYGGVRIRLRTLRQRTELLETKVQERTEELAQTVEQLRLSEYSAHESEQKAIGLAAKAQEANLAKSVFLSNMSHELRTPLNAILGFAQLLEHDRRILPEHREYLDMIHRSGEHLLGLINDVLSISKIEAGKITLNEQVFNLPNLLRNLEEMTRIRAQAKGLTLTFSGISELPHFVRGDDGKVRQILLNLLSNAVKFTSQGRITLRARWHDDEACFEVEDTGFGISQEEQSTLFEAFVQTQSGRRTTEGTGLGLALSRNFARLMGGDITVQSELGKGSAFRLTLRLPLAPSEPVLLKPMRRVVGLEPGQSPIRLLVVDDLAENRMVLTTLLTSVGFEVREAVNGEEAIAVWENWQPHLIWMDMRMPVMDGKTATAIIKQKAGERRHSTLTDSRISDTEPQTLNPESQTPFIIALTASAFEHDKASILALGCDDFVAKPFQAQVIFDTVSHFLGVRLVSEEVAPLQSEQATESIVTAERLKLLPATIIERLSYAILTGDQDTADEVVNDITCLDEPLGQELRKMMKLYQFDELQEIIDQIPVSKSDMSR